MGDDTMRKVLVIMGFLAILGLGAPAAAQTDKPAGDVCTLKVKGMACSACASKVEQTALTLDGVKAAKVDQPKGTAEITYDASKTDPAAIAKYISDKSGFKAEYEPGKATPKG
jgi:copper chaperone CopZ